MTKRELAALISKSFSIYLFILVLNSLPVAYLPAFLYEGGPSPMNNVTRMTWFVHTLPVVANMIACLFLWFCADGVASHMVKNESSLAVTGNGPELQAIAFSALGLFTLLQSIPYLGQIAASIIYPRLYSGDPNAQFMETPTANIVTAALRLLCGFWLWFGAPGLVRLLKSFRTAGMDKQNP